MTWQIQYCLLLSSIAKEGFGTRPPPYKTILKLDLRTREFAVPPTLAFKMPGEQSSEENLSDTEAYGTEEWLQRLLVLTLKENSQCFARLALSLLVPFLTHS